MLGTDYIIYQIDDLRGSLLRRYYPPQPSWARNRLKYNLLLDKNIVSEKSKYITLSFVV